MARAYWHSKNWGGTRQGAGRPTLSSPTRRISITLPQDLIDAVDKLAYQQHATRSAVIARALTWVIANPTGHTQPEREQ